MGAVPLVPWLGLEGQRREARMGARLEVVSAPRRFGVRIHHRGTESTVSRRCRSRQRVLFLLFGLHEWSSVPEVKAVFYPPTSPHL